MRFLVLLIIFYLNLEVAEATEQGKRLALYQSLDPTSISEHFAFADVYKGSCEAKIALQDAWKLIIKENKLQKEEFPALLFPENIDAFIQLIQPADKARVQKFEIGQEALQFLEECTSYFPNRQLKGNRIETEDELIKLPSSEIDLAHALFFLQFGNSIDGKLKRRTHEAALDLMALQVLARVSFDASPLDKIRVINDLIFHEMGFRFPPQSGHLSAIDTYTALPSVLESRRGVCLGVSVVYLSIAQRVGLPLEIVTPPGHIFVRYRNGEEEVNIETTLRGVHIASEEYLDINSKRLKTHPLKEVIGMVFMNEASTFLQKTEWERALSSYKIAYKFMPNDTLLHELLGCSLLLTGHEKEGKKHLALSIKAGNCDQITQDPLAYDLLYGYANTDCLKALFLANDESRKSHLAKKEALLKVCKSHPQFRSGHFQLASLLMGLQRPQEAIDILEKICLIDQNDITCEYYLATLYHIRAMDPLAVKHLNQAEKIAAQHDLFPRPLKELKTSLSCHGSLQETCELPKR